MKKRNIFVLVILMGLMLVSTSPAFALSRVIRSIKVNSYFIAPPDWGGEYHVWMQGRIINMNQTSHKAIGNFNWQIYNPELGWRALNSELVCVVYSPDGASAAFISRITNVIGWGQGVPGEYAYYWVKDGKLPGGGGDAFAINYYSYDPFIEFWPIGPPPDCNYFDPGEYAIPTESGEIIFRH